MLELVAFFGNPGEEYRRTRHNAGWLLGERLPFFQSLPWRQRFKGRYAELDPQRLEAEGRSPLEAEGRSPEESPGREVPSKLRSPEDSPGREVPSKLRFIIPETYMNHSGESVYAAASFFKIPPDRILVIHDELELPLGFGSLKFSGGLGGHNGLRSMRACFGTPDFWRLRIGIGRPDHRDIAGWVLSAFTAGELARLDQVLTAEAAALLEALVRGPESLLPAWNKKRLVD